MSTKEHRLPTADDRQVFQKSQIQVVIPASSRTLSGDANDGPIPEQQRESLFYDEIVTVLVLLRTQLEYEALEACCRHITASVYANLAAFPQSTHGTTQTPSGEPPIKLLLDSVDLSTPKAIVSAESAAEQRSIAVFEAELHLRHPGRLLNGPSLNFAASISLAPTTSVASDPLDEYLPSGIPIAANVLSPLRLTPQSGESSLYLPATRLERAVPYLDSSDNEAKWLRASSQALPVKPAIVLRTSRALLPGVVYLALDIHCPHNAPTEIQMDKVGCSINGRPVREISANSELGALQPGDRTTFVFQADDRAAGATAEFSVSSSISFGSGRTHRIHTSRALKPSLPGQTPTRIPIKLWSSAHRNSRATLGSVGSPERETAKLAGGELKISISGPSRIAVGSVFNLTFSILNQSPRRRRLHILSPPLNGANTDRQSRTSWIAPTWADNPQNIAPAVLEPRELLTATVGKQERRRSGTNRAGKSLTAYHAETIPLDTEVKIGTLAAGASTEARLSLQALSVGVVSIEGLVVIDLDSRETCVIGDGWEALCVDEDAET